MQYFWKCFANLKPDLCNKDHMGQWDISLQPHIRDRAEEMPKTSAVAYHILKCGSHSDVEKGEESLENREYKKGGVSREEESLIETI